MGKRSRSNSDDSSGEEDGSAEWKAAIESIASTTTFGGTKGFVNGSTSVKVMGTKPVEYSTSNAENDDDDEDRHWKPQKLKHYHIKAQRILDEIVGKNLEVVRDHVHIPSNNDVVDDCGVRLFKRSPLGIVFDHRDELQGPRKKPRILPGEKIDVKSKKFKQEVRSVVVDGVDILTAAKNACQKSLDRLEAKEAAAKAKAKREEERVAELKRIRGERWLPSIAREMQVLRNGRG